MEVHVNEKNSEKIIIIGFGRSNNFIYGHGRSGGTGRGTGKRD